MKKDYVAEIRENDLVQGAFLVTEKNLSTSRSGSRYLRLKLSDRTGEIEARIWEGVEERGRLFQKGDLVAIKAEAVSYQGRLQLNILELRPCSEAEVDMEDFIPPARRPPEEMLEELQGLARRIEDPFLRRLVFSFLRDDSFLEDFLRVPASKRLHHARHGGLIEHTLSVARLVERLRGHYPGVDWDLLLAGAILHDVGKVRELKHGMQFEYTSHGRLLGHVVMGVEMVAERIASIEGFPEERAMLLKHLILSHHGRYEWGAPRRPKTVEAELLHHLDDLDAKVEGILDALGRSEGAWTEYHRAFERPFYRGDKG